MSLIETLQSYWNSDNIISLALNKDIRTQVEEHTKFLDSYYSKVQLRSRVYVLINRLNESTLPKCKCGCGKVAAIDQTYPERGFRLYSGPECSRKSKTVSSEVLSKLDNYDWIYEQKIVQQKSIEQIAEILGISTTTVVKYLKKFNLYRLNDARKIDPKRVVNLENYELMFDYYITQNLTLRDIAKLTKTSTSTVIKYLNFHNIQIKRPNSYERKHKRSSKEETELYQFIQSLESEKVQQGNRKILNGKEIDIFIPKKNIGIEYNGIYSHLYRKNESTLPKIKGRDYHLSKTLICKDKGINLFQIYSSEWNYEKEKVKDFIRRKLHLNSVVTIDNNYEIIETKEKGKIKLTLVYDYSNVIEIILKSNIRHLVLDEYTVNPSLTLKDGFIKILTYLKNKYNLPIYAKIDRRFSEGRLFTSYGFKVIREISPQLLYTDNSYDKLYESKIPNKVNYEIYNCGYLILKFQ